MRSEGVLRRSAILLAALVMLLLSAMPAEARTRIKVTSSERPFASGNVELLGTLPVGHPIGARFRGDVMYVTGTDGLWTYDVSNPESPMPLGHLPLPHFENEDVDLGGDILLISNDPSEGVGLLYVVDISDPRLPKLRSVMGEGLVVGVPGAPVRELGEGEGHTVSCIQDCRYAYLAGTAKGIVVVDLQNPDAPRIAGEFKPHVTGFATHDVQVDGQGLAWIVGYEGTAAYDTSEDPLNPRLVATTRIANSGQLGLPGPDPVFGLGGKGETPLDYIHHNSLRFDAARRPFRRDPERTYPAGGSGSVIGVVEEDYNRPTCEGAGSFQTWRLTDQTGDDGARSLELLDMHQLELQTIVEQKGWSPVTGLCSAHYFDQRNGLVAGGWYEEGARFLDVRDPSDIRQVGYWVPTKGETWSVLFAPTDPDGEIVYALDFARGIDVLRVDRGDLRTRTAPVRRSWLRRAGRSSRTGFSRESRFGFVCRLPTSRAL